MPGYIPPELVEKILSEIPNNKDLKTLSAASLVCKQWLPLARARLFADALQIDEDFGAEIFRRFDMTVLIVSSVLMHLRLVLCFHDLVRPVRD